MLSEPKRDWLIWEGWNELWWGPDSKGYTRNILLAGLYTEQEAKRIESKATDTRRDRIVHVSTEREQIERLRAGLARMIEALSEEPAIHYGSLGMALCGANEPNMALTTAAENFTCTMCKTVAGERLVLNAYGRRCYDAGRDAFKAEAIVSVQRRVTAASLWISQAIGERLISDLEAVRL